MLVSVERVQLKGILNKMLPEVHTKHFALHCCGTGQEWDTQDHTVRGFCAQRVKSITEIETHTTVPLITDLLDSLEQIKTSLHMKSDPLIWFSQTQAIYLRSYKDRPLPFNADQWPMKMASEVARLLVRSPLLVMLHWLCAYRTTQRVLLWERQLLRSSKEDPPRKKAKLWTDVHSCFYSIRCHVLKEWRQMFGWTLLSIPLPEWTSSSQRWSRRTSHHNSWTHCTGTKPLRFPLLSRKNPSVSSFFPTQICRAREGGAEGAGGGGRRGGVSDIQ